MSETEPVAVWDCPDHTRHPAHPWTPDPDRADVWCRGWDDEPPPAGGGGPSVQEAADDDVAHWNQKYAGEG